MENQLPSVYVETSIVSYLSARDGYQRMQGGRPICCPAQTGLGAEFSSLAINDRAIEIAETLLTQGIVPKKAAEDALHVAIATAHGMDFLLTWNCRHIANPVIQAQIAAHLESIGLLLPFICTPEELLGEENE